MATLKPGCLAIIIVDMNASHVDAGKIVRVIEKVPEEHINISHSFRGYEVLHNGRNVVVMTKSVWIVENKESPFTVFYAATNKIAKKESLPIDSKFLIPLDPDAAISEERDVIEILNGVAFSVFKDPVLKKKYANQPAEV